MALFLVEVLNEEGLEESRVMTSAQLAHARAHPLKEPNVLRASLLFEEGGHGGLVRMAPESATDMTGQLAAVERWIDGPPHEDQAARAARAKAITTILYAGICLGANHVPDEDGAVTNTHAPSQPAM